MSKKKNKFKYSEPQSVSGYVDPTDGENKRYSAIHKVKRDGLWIIMVEKGKEVLEYDYDEFAKANPDFKQKLSN